jgi:RNA polymerase sigma-70 factor (ECF subfamily)
MSDDSPSIEADASEPSARRLERLFDECRDELLGTLYYVVGNLEDARDALQESFLKCWHRREQLPEVENLRAWVFRIALNTGRDLRKTAWSRRRQSLREDLPMPSTSDSPPKGLIDREEMQRFRVAIAQLPAEQQEVFLLRQNGDLTYCEIAESLSLPLGTVKTRMRLAIRQLRGRLGDN